MEENQETVESRSSFEDLNNPDKVRAILGAVLEPVSKDLAFKFSGIDLNELNDEEKRMLEAIFEEEGIEKSKVGNQERYCLSDDARIEIENEIDMPSVHSRIADILLEQWEKEKEERKRNI